MNKWTDEQLKAIETRECNLLVAAAAGAGKTAVLVERIVRMITDEKNPVDIDSLLVVTFTNAAAAEMRERIADAITKKLDENPHSRRLQNQLTLLNKANIMTIHSFCLEVIKNNFHRIDLDPGFRIGDETETRLLREEALEELFEERYENGLDEDFINLIESYGSSKDDIPIQDMVLNLYNFSISSENPKLWLQRCIDAFNIDEDFSFSDSIWTEAVLSSVSIDIKAALNLMEEALDIINKTPELEGYSSQFTIELNLIRDIYNSSKRSYRDLYNSLYSFNFERLKGSVKDADKDIKDKVQSLRNTVKDDIIKPLKEEFFSLTDHEISKQIKSLYPVIKSLCNLVMDFKKKYSKMKKEKGIIDFSDIEHYCLDILIEDGKPSDVALLYRDKFNEILIDEYQDSNYIQETILTSIARDNPKNVFMVGDVKQSIYRFRNAKPELFLDKYNKYEDEKGDTRRILLYKNFRSREQVIDGVNYIFKQLMSKNIGEMDYTDREKLNKGANYEKIDDSSIAGGDIELHIIERQNDEEENEDEEFIGNIELEALAIANRIKDLIKGENGKSFKVFDKREERYRNVEYRDIVILLRATSNWADTFEQVMSLEGIPIFSDTGVGYFNTTEIKTIISLLQIIDNPMQDIPLIAVLRSPIFSFTPDELIDIRMGREGGSFYEALKERKNNADELSSKINSFINKLISWQDRALYMSTDELIWFLYSDTGYYGYTGAMPSGVQRQANLRVLFERAREYEKTSYKGLFNFISFIEKLKRSNADFGSAKILGENENVVRIMSIHKSKGLEFPVVILAGCGKNFNKIDLRKKILCHYNLLLGPDYVDYKRRVSISTIVKEAIKRKINVESLSEEMRVLYVAFTRAKEKLIITGSVKDIKKSAIKWSETLRSNVTNIDEYDVLKASGYLDWIGRCIIRHPDAKNLRDIAGIKEYEATLNAENSRWSINIIKRNEIVNDKAESIRNKKDIIEDIKNIDIDKYESPFWDEIKRRLEYEYKYDIYTTLPAKLTVSEVKRIWESNDMDEESYNIFEGVKLRKPIFLDKRRKLSPAQIGTLIHSVMQHINLEINLNLDGIKEDIYGMVSKGIIKEEDVKYINISQIENFFNSQLGIRMINSDCIKREVPFHINIPVKDVYKNLPNDINEDIIVQGMIDCCFKEDNEFVLIDYKTDYVRDINKITEKYRIQVDLYARALEEITGIRVKNKYIYFFSTGDIIEY